MRIDRLTLQNFRKFKELTIDLHPQFTLLVGGNGSGKTTILNALAISLYDLLSKLPNASIRNLELEDVTLVPIKVADRIQFRLAALVTVKVVGKVGYEGTLEWGQSLSSMHQRSITSIGERLFDLINDDPPSELPVLAFYGVNRATSFNDQSPNPSLNLNFPQRFDAYAHCLNEQIDYDNLRHWFFSESAAAGENGGHRRPGYEVVRRAILSCLPGADDLVFSVDRRDLVCSIAGQAQPLSNLSDGQRMLLAMVADIAVKAVTLNAHLLPSDKLGLEDEPIPRVLRDTPGVVLIDELDVHLHPSWQRRVAADLKRTFPSIQFVCTSHSPQVIGEVPPEQIRIIEGETVYSPEHSFGVDSSRILEEVMDTKPRTESVDALLSKLARQISDDDFDGARATISEAETQLGANDPEITSARTLMAFVEQK